MITIPGIASDMIANNIEPDRPTHPGEVLKEELEYRGISQRKFAAQIGVQYTMLNEILNAKRAMNVQFAMLVEAALNIDAELWINMQTRYNMYTAKKDKSFIERLANIRKVASVL
ncbi:addiction module HigA family antidote [Parabacteroides sp. PF5-5]|uniref:HigA family addiction module antitoxin n=1 Tax=unclassified Parabacteroides TaxID=2649774 RepID=UPI002476253B|nr:MULTISPECIES: HigA family addiction module antitoxin [unclassified Parabacteroides]MDH6306805.1 addiction module HigA family antidote [Parabacteroides sp. PH5-39]MDH6317691.1 addiction module HigA family antidote [Parabacteroides sp. PF5-13]MDH6321517.1 addiction module HigA family antidote [Parabacteroides sp. PH5-13]MDH6325206.1 addiction module HigA family antidote [Parabacteroides sp. PH5-8]MDH6328876.1 addiction module HigA family antidote [Parabacteroides sp. PH5-41]